MPGPIRSSGLRTHPPAAVKHVRVDHRWAHSTVPEQLLDHPNVVPGFEDVRGERVAERMAGGHASKCRQHSAQPSDRSRLHAGLSMGQFGATGGAIERVGAWGERDAGKAVGRRPTRLARVGRAGGGRPMGADRLALVARGPTA